MTLGKGKRVESGEEMKLKSPSRKQIIWLLVFILLITWGVQRRNQGIKDAKMQAKVSAQLSKAMEIQGKKDLDSFIHGNYQFYVCSFSGNLKPVSEMLINISKKTSIPPDFIPVMKDFNDAVEFLSTAESVFLGHDGKLTEEELKIQLAAKSIAKELNLKTVELEQGIIKFSNPYFSKLNNTVTSLVAPACALYETTRPKKSSTPSPTPTATKSPFRGSTDFQIDKIGRELSYDSICKLNASSKSLLFEIENAELSRAFKSSLLESSKTTIYDLDYAAFSFSGKGLYTRTPSEIFLSLDIKTLKSKLEKYRYEYWSSSSKKTLISMRTLAIQIQSVGSEGCTEANRLKKQ